jgi:hypothetical protein
MNTSSVEKSGAGCEFSPVVTWANKNSAIGFFEMRSELGDLIRVPFLYVGAEPEEIYVDCDKSNVLIDQYTWRKGEEDGFWKYLYRSQVGSAFDFLSSLEKEGCLLSDFLQRVKDDDYLHDASLYELNDLADVCGEHKIDVFNGVYMSLLQFVREIVANPRGLLCDSDTHVARSNQDQTSQEKVSDMLENTASVAEGNIEALLVGLEDTMSLVGPKQAVRHECQIDMASNVVTDGNSAVFSVIENDGSVTSFRVKMVLVTSSVAKKWLDEANHDNRSMRNWWSVALANRMKAGEWLKTHQGIAFTKSGRLLDGQHRLKAIVESEIPTWSFVFEGLDDEAFKAIDSGVKRNLSDLTGLSRKEAEVCRLAAEIVFGSISATISSQQVLDVAASGLVDVHAELMRKCPTISAYYSSTAMRLAACALVMDGVDKDWVFDVYAGLALQRFEQLPQVALGLIRQVINKKAVSNGRRSDVLARGLRALNPKNADLTKIQISDDDGKIAVQYVRTVIRKAMSA